MGSAVTTSESEQARARRRERERRGFRAQVAAWAIRITVAPLRIVPVPVAFFIGRRFADFLWLFLPSRRRIADENLRTAFGEQLSARDRARIGRESVRRFSMTLVEGVLLPGWIRTGRLERVAEAGAGNAEAFARQQRGEPIIFFSGHFGPWEVSARQLVRLGWRIGLPYRSTKNEVLQDWIVRTRAIAGPEQFPRKGALRPLMRLLKEGAAVTMFLDQNERGGLFVDFFGRPAATVTTVGVLAERTGAAVYLQVPRRVVPGQKYRVDFEGPLTIPDGGTTEERIHAWTQLATARIEARIRENPAEWLWIHRRWRSRPLASTPSEPAGTMPSGSTKRHSPSRQEETE